MDLIVFNQRVRHGTLDFHPKLTYGFEDADAAPYFKACGWADDVSDNQQPDVVISIGELDIDPLTVWGNGDRRGMFVMPTRAAEHLRAQGHSVTDEWASNYTASFTSTEQLVEQLNAEGHL
jgi:hypothetical protein